MFRSDPQSAALCFTLSLILGAVITGCSNQSPERDDASSEPARHHPTAHEVDAAPDPPPPPPAVLASFYEPRPAGTLTFNRDIAPIIFDNCSICHRPGEAAPFSLLSYEDVRRRARQIAVVTRDRFMPPWLPDSGYVEFADDRSLTVDQIGMISQWFEEGMTEGDPEDLPEAPVFTEGWQLGEPDLIVQMPEPYTLPAEGPDVFRNFVLPISIDEPKWVRTVEFRPGNARAVHHAVVQIDRTQSTQLLDESDPELGFGGMFMGDSQVPDGHYIGWTPGNVVQEGDPDMAWRLEDGDALVVQLHMPTLGRPEPVRSQLGLHYADGPPTKFPWGLLLRVADIDITAGEKNYVVTDHLTIPVDVHVLGVYPHAHYIGKDIQGYATLPDGSQQWLIRISDWNFNWQDDYEYAEPIFLPAGTIVSMRYRYDNSADNVLNPNNPPKRVMHGWESTDEMGSLLLQVLPKNKEELLVLREAMDRHRLESFPDHWAAHNNLGNRARERGEYDVAIEHYLKAIEVNPKFGPAHYNLGVTYQTIKRFDDAATQYRIAQERMPGYAPPHYNLGLIHLEQSDWHAAIDAFEAAIRIDDRMAQAYLSLGSALSQIGRHADAAANFGKTLELEPENAVANTNLGILLSRAGRLREALVLFQRAIDVDNQNVNAINGAAWILATHEDENVRDAEQAITVAEKLVEVTNRRNVAFLTTLAAAHAGAGNYQRAAEIAKEAIALAQRAGAPAVADELRSQLELYEAGKPYLIRGLSGSP